ncbi:uncharacterized protein LOC141901617 isoform X1 [Tubulanus polymorphus]|uniref:uncharacterized protein LOC141901617 isoform X1 n=1 Tax=Tubulanus polymorphus TaxID=672921 RepID=UPI003DA621AF
MVFQKKRLFIGGLFSDITDDALADRFKQFGDVTAVEIKLRRDEEGNVTNAFAHLNIEGEENRIQRCIQTFNKTKWNGAQITVELAKESFLDRLRREREQRNKTDSSASKPPPPEFIPKAKPGDSVPGEKDWVVSKYGRPLPIMHLSKETDARKTITINPSKFVHNIRKLKEDEINAGNDISNLTWQIEDDVHEKQHHEKNTKKKFESSSSSSDSSSSDSDSDEKPSKKTKKINEKPTVRNVKKPASDSSSSDSDSSDADSNTRHLKGKTKTEKQSVKKSSSSDSSSSSSSDSSDELSSDDKVVDKQSDVFSKKATSNSSHSSSNSIKGGISSDLNDRKLNNTNDFEVVGVNDAFNWRKKGEDVDYSSDDTDDMIVASKNPKQKSVNSQLHPSSSSDDTDAIVENSKILPNKTRKAKKLTKVRSKTNEKSAESSSRDSSDVEKNAKVKHSENDNTNSDKTVSGTSQKPSSSDESSSSSSEEDRDRNTTNIKQISAVIKNDSKGASKNGHSNEDLLKTTAAKKHELDNKKRLESLRLRGKEASVKKLAIQAALKQVDSQPLNKRVVFDSEDEDMESLPEVSTNNIEQPKIKKVKSAKNKKVEDSKPKLFDSDDSDDDNAGSSDSDNQDMFRERPQFEGKSGQQLMKLQNKIGTDERFRMDKRFLADISDDENESLHGQIDLFIDKMKKSGEFELLVEMASNNERLGKDLLRIAALKHPGDYNHSLEHCKILEKYDDDAYFSNKVATELLKIRCSSGRTLIVLMDSLLRKFKQFISDVETAECNVAEKERSLNILKGILGNKVLMTSRKKSDISTTHVRYDPTREDHDKYEIKNDSKLKPEKKSKKSKLGEDEVEVRTEPEVSKERFYEVAADLKNAIDSSEKTPFSFFGDSSNTEATVEKTKPNLAENRKSESVDLSWRDKCNMDTSENDKIEHETEEKGSSSNIHENQGTIVESCRDTFFFTIDDIRIKEGIEFFQATEDPDELRENWNENRQKAIEAFRLKRKRALRTQGKFKNKPDRSSYERNGTAQKRRFGRKQVEPRAFKRFKSR